MVDIILYSVGGFLAALALALLTMPFFSRRAAERAVRRLHETMPFSTAEVEAQKDHLRAEHAVRLRKVELEADKNAETVGRQKIELRTFREKLEGANKIMKANKLALEEMREKQDALNDRLRHSEAKYASLDQRARQAIREKNEYQLQIKRLEKKNIATPNLKPGPFSMQPTPEISSSGLPIADASLALHPSIEAELEDLKKKLVNERQRADKLTAELNERERAQSKKPEKDEASGNDMALLREKLFTLAADISALTAKLEGEDSDIHKILAQEGDVSTLSERMSAVINKISRPQPEESPMQDASVLETANPSEEPEKEQNAPQKNREARRKKRKKLALPKAEGLDLKTTKATNRKSAKTDKPEDTPA